MQENQLEFLSDLYIFLFQLSHSPHSFYATPFIYILSIFLPSISLSSMPFSGAQRELTALTVVVRPTHNNKQAQSSYLCCASPALSICQYVCFALHMETMNPSSPVCLLPPYETSERLLKRNCKNKMGCNMEVLGDGFG